MHRPLPTPVCGCLLKTEPLFQERVWGGEDLSPFYSSRPAEPRRVGEVWLTGDQNRVANGAGAGGTLGELVRTCGPALLGGGVHSSQRPDSPAFPLLVKFLFTTDKLSVQVHPPDAYARQRERSAGKTEMWYAVRAEPGAALAIGFRDDLSGGQPEDRQTLRAAVESGAIEGMLQWMEVRSQDAFFVPAGTVHAIGAGVVLCEIQQNSDVTYRLYDYNRPGTDGHPRPLHVEKALDVLQWRSPGGRTRPIGSASRPDTGLCLAACPYFATEKWVLDTLRERTTRGRFEIWIGLQGEAAFEAAGGHVSCRGGEAVIVPADVPRFTIRPSGECVFLRTFPPDLEADVIAPLRAQGFSEEALRGVCFP